MTLATYQRSCSGLSGPSDRRERVTERHHSPVNSEELSAIAVCDERESAASGKEFTTKPGASE